MLYEQETRFLIRDQDDDTRRTLDLLQAWGPPAREPLRMRAGRALVRLGRRLQGSAADRDGDGEPSHCAMC